MALIGNDYDTVESESVRSLISQEAYDYLKSIGVNQEEDFRTYNVLEGILAVTFFTARFRKDRYNRWTYKNHTFLVNFEEYTEHIKLFNMFQPHVSEEPDCFPASLEPIKIGE